MGDRTGDNYDSADCIVCDCGKEESEHTFGGGTLVQDSEGHYICDQYSQIRLRKRSDGKRRYKGRLV